MTSFKSKLAFAFLICLMASIISCKDKNGGGGFGVAPEVVLEGTRYARFDHDGSAGKVYQVLEFNKLNQGRTDYRVDKKVLYASIAEFTYRHNSESVWLTTTTGKGDKYVQEGVFVGRNILLGGQLFYPEK